VAIGDRIVLKPDASGRFLWAEYGFEGERLLAAIRPQEFMVAGGRFELYSAYPIRVPSVSASVVRTT